MDGVWFVEIGIGLAALVLANFVLKKVVQKMRTRPSGGEEGWKSKLDHIVYLPLRAILTIIGAFYVLHVLGRNFGFADAVDYLESIRDAAIVCCLGWLLHRWKTEAQHGMMGKGPTRLDASMAQAFGRLLSVAIVVLTTMIALQMLGLDIAPLIAFGGIGAAAAGFAAKDVIANFFGGLMLQMTRPFMVGDLITAANKGIEGYVEEIGWYLTSIRDKDKRPVYVPNALFSTMLVVNHSRMSHRRIEMKIGMRYDDVAKVGGVVQEVRAAILSHPSIDANLPVLVFFNAFSEYSLDIYVDVYSLTTKWDAFLAVRQEILMRIQEVFDRCGVRMPFPTTTLDF
jgi:MscS family membrane protein